MADETRISRREAIRRGFRSAAAVGMVTAAGYFSLRHPKKTDHTVWQIDPEKCIACGNCADYCVLKTSAVKCVRAFSRCGKCNFCFGYYETAPESQPGAGAENQMCPTDAIVRHHLGGPYFEYTIDDDACIACALCVKGCNRFGNGSMNLQIRHDRCLNCNRCTIADACPADAFSRVPSSEPYMLWKRERSA